MSRGFARPLGSLDPPVKALAQLSLRWRLVSAAILLVLTACTDENGPATVATADRSAPAPSTAAESSTSLTPVERTTASTEPAPAVVEGLLGILEMAYVRDLIDWDEVRRDAELDAASAGVDIALRRAVASVSRVDKHSFWVAADRAAASLGTRAPEPLEVSVGADGVAVVSVGEFKNPDPNVADSYVEEAHAALAGLEPDVCGVVVDLSDHTGGNMWPGLAALAPLNSGDPVGFFVRDENDMAAWFVERDRVGYADTTVLTFPIVTSIDVPLAVVLGRRTGSSGEAVALSLLGRHDVRSFGESTVGVASANTRFPLSDGSAVFLTTALMADRSGTIDTTGREDRAG